MELEPIWENEYPGPDCDRKYWDEDGWERFIIDQDRKAEELSRLADLFTASGMVDRDNELMKPEENQEYGENFCCDCGGPIEESPSEDVDEEIVSGSHRFREIPAYCLAHDFAIETIETLKGVSGETFNSDPAFGKLTANCCIAGAKIAGGHGLGYRPDSIYGNVVKCKQAVDSLTASLEALEVLVTREDFRKEAIKLRQMAQLAISETRVRIEELRAAARRLHGEIEQ